jgi:hypothetical protein
MVEREYTAHLRDAKDADAMVEAGVVDGALDLYAQRGEWDKVRFAAVGIWRARIVPRSLGVFPCVLRCIRFSRWRRRRAVSP